MILPIVIGFVIVFVVYVIIDMERQLKKIVDKMDL